MAAALTMGARGPGPWPLAGRTPRAHDGGVAGLDLQETHTSWLLLTAGRVYKVKKPVRYELVDLRTAAARWRVCRAEVELNRRLAPDVYEGVGRFSLPDGTEEPVVVMRRLAAGRNLARLVRAGSPDLGRDLAAVAATLAGFHLRARTGGPVSVAGRPDRVLAMWDANVAGLLERADGVLDRAPVDSAAALGRLYLSGRAPLLDARVGAGRIVDGHGDLLCDDVFCLDDGPRLLDCLEFDESLRCLDMRHDAAALAADLERLGRPDAAAAFLAEHARATLDAGPDSLDHFYVAHRALVRAKVACIRARAGARSPGPATAAAEAAAEAAGLVAIALDHARRATVRMVLVGGLPGSGKSSLAAALSRRTGWPVVGTDDIRKRMAGIDPSAPAGAAFGAGIYTPDVTAAVYAELISEAEELAGMGRSVILDGSWIRRCWRDAAATAAEQTRAVLVELLCEVPDPVATARIRRRAAAPAASDATPATRRSMAGLLEPWPDALVVDTTGPLDEVADRVAAALGPY